MTKSSPEAGDIVREICGGRNARTARVMAVLPCARSSITLQMVDLATGKPFEDDPEWWKVVVSPIRLR